MEGRPSRGRGGSWKKVDRGGINNDEHRGRGRGGHHRGRGRRDHYRGRGRGENTHALHHPEQDEEEEGHQEEDGGAGGFSRRKLESNWDRYKESEKQEPDNDKPTRRGTDYHVLLESAGDSFTQFRFSEEKVWDMDSFAASQPSAVCVDLIAQILQELPVHQRLNLEAELEQVSIPSHLPAEAFTPKQEASKLDLAPPLAGFKKLATVVPAATDPDASISSNAAASPPVDDDDDELDHLLNLKKPAAGNQSDAGEEKADSVPEKGCEDMKEVTEKKETARENDITPPESTSARKEVTQEELEDWLDSMIS